MRCAGDDVTMLLVSRVHFTPPHSVRTGGGPQRAFCQFYISLGTLGNHYVCEEKQTRQKHTSPSFNTATVWMCNRVHVHHTRSHTLTRAHTDL